MALYTKKQFCELLGIDSSYLSTYIRRGKVIAQGDYIDDTLEQNKNFLQSRLDLQKKKTEDQPTEKKKKKIVDPPPTVPPPSLPDYDEEEIPDFTLDQLEKMAETKLDKEKKRLEILNKHEDLEIARIKKHKMLGEIIPVDLVKNIFKQHFKDIDDAFNQGADSIAVIMVKRLGGTRDDLTHIRKEIVSIINKKIQTAMEVSELEVKNIVREYSQQRGRGER